VQLIIEVPVWVNSDSGTFWLSAARPENCVVLCRFIPKAAACPLFEIYHLVTLF
jgi:hypothetical protein